MRQRVPADPGTTRWPVWKVTWVALALMVASLALAACGGGDDDDDDTSGTPTPTATATTEPDFNAEEYFSGKTIRILVTNAAGGGTDRHARFLESNWSEFFPGNPDFRVTNFDGPIPAANLLAQADPDGLTMLVSSQSLLDIEAQEAANFSVADFESIGGHIVPGNEFGIRGDLPYDTFEEARGTDVALKFGSAAQAPGEIGAFETRLIILAEAFDIPLQILPISGATSTSTIMVPFERGEVNVMSAAWWRIGPLRPDWIETGYMVPFAYYGPSSIDPPEEFPAPDVAPFLEGDNLAAWKALAATVPYHKYMWLPPGTPAGMVDAYQQAWSASIADSEFLEGFGGTVGFETFFPVEGDEFHEVMQQSVVDYEAGVGAIERISAEHGPTYFR